MMAKIIELGNDKIKINYFGKNKEDDRWVDDSNDKLKKQVLILDRHKAEERRGAFPKLGDGVLVRVVPAKDANIYTAFGTGLLGTCIKCLPQNDCSVVKIEPNLLLKEGFIGTFANGWLSIRYKDHFAQEKCNFIHSTIRCLKEEVEEEEIVDPEEKTEKKEKEDDWWVRSVVKIDRVGFEFLKGNNLQNLRVGRGQYNRWCTTSIESLQPPIGADAPLIPGF